MKRLRDLCGPLALAGWLLTCLMGQGADPKPQSLRVASLQVVDDAGRVRAELGVRHEGAFFTVFDADGHKRMCVGVLDGGDTPGPFAALCDSKEKTRISLSSTALGQAFLILNERGGPQASIGALVGVGPSVTLLDEKSGKIVWSAP